MTEFVKNAEIIHIKYPLKMEIRVPKDYKIKIFCVKHITKLRKRNARVRVIQKHGLMRVCACKKIKKKY